MVFLTKYRSNMSRFLYILFALLALLSAPRVEAQTIAIGESAPRIMHAKWLNDNSPRRSRYTYVQFILSKSIPCRDTATRIHNSISKSSGIAFVLVTPESAAEVEKWAHNLIGPMAGVVVEDRSIRTSFGVNYVPYAVILGRKHRVLWFGNPQQLDLEKIKKLTKK
jgi:hypothetical protein